MSPDIRRYRQRGMMLLEVLVVVAIMGLIAGGVGLAAYEYFSEAKVKTAATSARTLRLAVKARWLHAGDGQCPTLEDLAESGDIDEDSPKTDPWGRPWRIDCDGSRISVGSDGPDRKENTSDDIRVPPREGTAQETPPT